MVSSGHPRRFGQCGVGYLFMLLAVFLLSLGLGKTLEIYSTIAQREKEADLAYIGGLYREAIKDYFLSAPNGQHKYPARLEDLLKDSRHLVTRRYLRRLYLDPMTSQGFTLLIAPQGGIWGVASSSGQTPLRMAPAELAPGATSARTYRDWQFVYQGAG